MDWLCPGYSSALHTQLTSHYGNITAENTIRNITSIVQTGLSFFDCGVRVCICPLSSLY